MLLDHLVFRALRDMFGPASEGAHDAHEVQNRTRLAAAVLLVEVSRADQEVKGEERVAVDRILREGFRLTSQEAAALVRRAEEEADRAASLFEFTHLIGRSWPMERKVRIIEWLWRVAYADAHRHHHEEHLIRRIADLLHVPHSAFIQTRNQIEAETR